MFDLNMEGLRTYFCLPAPSHNHRLQWLAAGAYESLPLRAQFRTCTGFPCDMFLNKKRGKTLSLSSVVAGVGFEPHDLRVMSPTSYRLLYPAILDCKYTDIFYNSKKNLTFLQKFPSICSIQLMRGTPTLRPSRPLQRISALLSKDSLCSLLPLQSRCLLL